MVGRRSAWANVLVAIFILSVLISCDTSESVSGSGSGQEQVSANHDAAWQPYLDTSGRSGVSEFLIGDDFIKVRFITSDKVYVYSKGRISGQKIEIMKQLALAGRGLNTFINQNRDVYYGFEPE